MPQRNTPFRFPSHLLVMVRPKFLSQTGCLHRACKNKKLHWVHRQWSHRTAWIYASHCRSWHAYYSSLSYFRHRSESADIYARLCQYNPPATIRRSSFPVQMCRYVLCALPDRWRLRMSWSNRSKFKIKTCQVNWRLRNAAHVRTFNLSLPVETRHWVPMRSY